MMIEILIGIVAFASGTFFASGLLKKKMQEKESQRILDLERAREEIQGKTEELNLLSSNVITKDKDLDSLQKKVKEQKELTQRREEENTSLQKMLEEYKEKLEQVYGTLEEKEKAAETLQLELIEKNKQLQEKEKIQQALMAENKDQETRLLESDKKILEYENDILEQQNMLDEKDEEIEKLQAELLESEEQIETSMKEVQKIEDAHKETKQSLQQMEEMYQKNVKLRVLALRDMKKIMESLESETIPENIDLPDEDEEVHFSLEEDTGMEEFSVQLAEQERLLKEQEELLEKQEQEIQELKQQQIKEQETAQEEANAEYKEKYEIAANQVEKMETDLANKEDMIQKYMLQIEELEKQIVDLKNAPVEAPQEVKMDALQAIEQDPNLSKAHKYAMRLLYAQYEEESKEEN